MHPPWILVSDNGSTRGYAPFMSTPFLLGFTESIVTTLVARDELLLAGDPREVVRFVSERLATSGEGTSLISTLAAALVACPAVDELFADDERLKELVTEMPRNVVRGGAR